LTQLKTISFRPLPRTHSAQFDLGQLDSNFGLDRLDSTYDTND